MASANTEQSTPANSSDALPSLPSSTHPISTPHTINIGTRKSQLARVQTDIVVAGLQRAWPQHHYEVHAISTMGDKNQVTALHDFGAKSLWTHELEAMLLNGQVDFIVHSLKDIPTQLPPSLTIGAVLPREDPRDALVLAPHLAAQSPRPTLAALPPGSTIGTSSVRRSAQLARLYPHLAFQSVRGNIGTRLGKLDAPQSPYAAIILAAAGLLRVDLGHRISALLDSANTEGARAGAWGMLHAVGQGALGIETREGDARVAQLLAPLVCARSSLACLAERSLLRTLEGGCSVPIGVETAWSGASGASSSAPSEPAPDETLTMRAVVVSLDGQRVATASVTKGPAVEAMARDEHADAFGREVAARLIDDGAAEILQEINLDRDVLEKQADGA